MRRKYRRVGKGRFKHWRWDRKAKFLAALDATMSRGASDFSRQCWEDYVAVRGEPRSPEGHLRGE